METTHSLRPNPPVKSDEDGNIRILIVGNAGAGKAGSPLTLTRGASFDSISVDCRQETL